MRVLVGDTGPLLHLCESDLLWILNKAGNVHVPSVVVRELKEQTPTSLSAWIIVSELSSSEEKEAKRLMLSGMLDAGEAGAICLAQRLRPDWFLTDDTAARIFAKSLGMEAHGSQGVLLWAAAAGYLRYSEAKNALERLSKTSLWISRDILQEAESALEKMFKA